MLSTLLKYSVGERSKLRFHVSGMMAEVHAVEPADIERLLTACNDDRHRAVILLAYEAGLRVGEIRGLQWTDERDGQLTIRRALDKQTARDPHPEARQAAEGAGLASGQRGAGCTAQARAVGRVAA